MSNYVDITPGTAGSVCRVCERPVGIVQEFVPFGRGIRHWNCEATCRGCGDRLGPGEEIVNETNDAFCEDCAESLCIDIDPDVGDEE